MAFSVGPTEGNIVDGGDCGRVWWLIDEWEMVKPLGERKAMDVVVYLHCQFSCYVLCVTVCWSNHFWHFVAIVSFLRQWEVSTMYPSIWSQCAQQALWGFFESLWENWATLRVYCGYFIKNPLGTFWSNWWVHCEHFVKEWSEFVQKVPTTYLLGMSQANWWALFENDQDLPAGYFAGQIDGYFLKVPTFYPLGLGWANGWVIFESAHYLPAGYELDKLFQNPQLTHNVPTGYIALRPQCWRDVCELCILDWD